MAKTLNEAAAKWRMNVQGKGSAWAEGVRSPRTPACEAFRKFVGSDSLAVKKYCQDYQNFLSNVGTYQQLYESGINNAISSNKYVTGLTR